MMSRQSPDESWHPFARAIWEHGTAKPGAEAVTDGHGHTVFKVRDKTFVYFGGPTNPGLSVKLSPGTRSQLKPDPSRTKDTRAYLLDGHPVTSTHYIGQHGWIDIDVDSRRALQLALDLIDESYAQMAPKGGRGAATKAKTTKTATKTKSKSATKSAAKKGRGRTKGD